jgi:hypothetical protein
MMEVKWDNQTYSFDLEECTTEQLVKIKRTYDLDISGLANGMSRGDIDVMRCVLWLMKQQSGLDMLRLEAVTIDKPVKFAAALLAGLIKEREALLAAAEKLAKEAAAAEKSTDPKD